MIRTIYVTGGRSDYAELTLTDRKGHDLSGLTIQLGVSNDPGTVPSTWYAPDLSSYPSVGSAVLSLLLNSTRAPAGQYWLWASVPDGATSQPVRASDMILTV